MSYKTDIKKLSSERIVVIIAVLVVTVPLGIFSAISIYSSSHALTEVIKKELEDKSVMTSYAINAFIDERIVDAKTISHADVLETGDTKQTSQYLTEIVIENQWIEDIDVLSLDGRIIASSGEQNDLGILFWSTQPDYKTLYLSTLEASQGEVYVSEAKVLDNGPGFFLITPITDDSNLHLIGLLAIEVNLKDISQIIKNLNQRRPDEYHVYIIDDSGNIILSNNPSVNFLDSFPDLQINPNLLKSFSQQGGTGNTHYTDSTNNDVMAGYADMAEFGENKALDWNIITIVSTNKITAPVSNLKNILLLLSAIVTLIATITSQRISLSYTDNLEKIATRAENISLGDYSEQLLTKKSRKGAFNTLVTAFNRMEANIKEMIRELKDREQRLNITLDSIGDGVIATDEKGNITLMNPTSEKLTGWTYKEAQGQSIKDVFPILDETSRKPIKNPIDKVIETGATVFLSDHTLLISKDGTEYHIEDSAAAIRDDNHNIYGMILIFSDVTRRKQVEKQYRRAQKMDALGKLTGGIAHDFNNMLSVIIGYCELLEHEIYKQPQLLKYVETIKESANRGASLTKKLLNSSKNKFSETVKCNFNTLLNSQSFMLEKTLTVRIELAFELAQDLWPVYLDENDAIDTILNISINAMHAIEGNGYITIRTNNKKINKKDALRLGLRKGNYVLLSIIDTGCGMDEHIKERIFDPFFSTKGENGTGLGLSQVYGFIQRSEGAIKVYSEKGHGTQFELYFPRYHGNETLKEPEEEVATLNTTTGTETILVVDDEPDLLQFCCKVLEKNGFKTLAAQSAQNALRILETEKITVLLGDVSMPEMDGYQLASIVKEKHPKVIIQLVSGYGEDQKEPVIYKNLQRKMLTKPYTQQELLLAINSLLNK